MPILPFRKASRPGSQAVAGDDPLDGFSIEVMPRTAAKIEDFRAILPPGTRVYVAHIEGTPLDDMVATARRIRAEGFPVMPHFPARIIPDTAELERWIDRYRTEAGVEEALVLAGGPKTPVGALTSSMELLDTGLFEKAGFTRLHVAGHPEGNRDIDRDGGTAQVDAALRWKQDYAARSSADMGIVTQFAFDAGGVLDWADRLAADGITLPVHLGIAGPAKLQTLIKFAVACGVGPSLSVLKKRARDLTQLVAPYEPDEMLEGLAAGIAAGRGALIERLHVFPLGGILRAADHARARSEARGGARAGAARQGGEVST